MPRTGPGSALLSPTGSAVPTRPGRSPSRQQQVPGSLLGTGGGGAGGGVAAPLGGGSCYSPGRGERSRPASQDGRDAGRGGGCPAPGSRPVSSRSGVPGWHRGGK
ncbi:unnamed protein product [Coccothraustes coccothraustes]